MQNPEINSISKAGSSQIGQAASKTPKIVVRTATKKKKKTAEEKREYEREKKRRQREKIRADPEQLEKSREYERNRNKRRRLEGKIKPISQMTKREKRKQRKKWRENWKRYSDRKKMEKNEEQFILNDSPPASPGEFLPIPQSSSSNKLSGRKKVRRDRSKMYRKIQEQAGKLKKSNALTEKWKKKYYKLLKVKANRSPTPRKKVTMIIEKGMKEVKKKLLFGEALQSQLKNKARQLTSQADKQMFYKCVAGQELKKYRCLKEATFLKRSEVKYRRTTDLVGCKRMIVNQRQKKGTSIGHRQVKDIRNFLEDDSNSCVAPGRKDVITKKKVTMRKRYLMNSLQNLHKKFCETKYKLSYATFCRYRPFWVVHPKPSARDTCLCIHHENIKLMYNKIHRLQLCKEKNLTELLNSVCCDKDDKDCMYRDCMRCKDKLPVFLQPADVNDEDMTNYQQWRKKNIVRQKKGKEITSNITVKETIRCSVQELKEHFTKLLVQFKIHVFNMCHQFKTLKDLRSKLMQNEAMVVMDFSENYTCKYSSEVQSAHFGGSKPEITIHTGVYFTSNRPKGQQFATISSNNRHDACAVWAHLKPILKVIKDENPNVDTIHLQSDGPTSQYKNRKALFLLTIFLKAMGMNRGYWNYTEPGHGKGIADAVGGQLKSHADKVVLQGKDITNEDELIKTLLDLKKVIIKRVSTEDINKIDKLLMESAPTVVPAVPNTLKVRQAVWEKDEEKTLHLRYLSCLQCKSSCKHYKLQPEVWSTASKESTCILLNLNILLLVIK